MGRHFFIFLAFFIGMPQAMAEFVISPSLSLTQSSLDKSYSKAKATSTISGTTTEGEEEDVELKLKTSGSTTSINLGIGWAMNNWLFLGAKVLSESGSDTDPTAIPTGSSSDDTSSVKYASATSGFGIAFGFLPNEKFNLVISYLVSLSRTLDITATDSDGDEAKLSFAEEGGSGLLVDIGWRFRMGAFGMGPMLTYKSLSFTKETQTLSGTDFEVKTEYTVSTTETSLSPYLGFWFQF